MKKRKIELDVDFIGEQKPLTREQELVLSEFFKAKKSHGTKRAIRKTRTNAKKKLSA